MKVAIIPDRIVKKYSKEEDKLHFVLVPQDTFNPNPLQCRPGLIIFPYWMLYAYDDKRAASRTSSYKPNIGWWAKRSKCYVVAMYRKFYLGRIIGKQMRA